MKKISFGLTASGAPVTQYMLQNSHGMQIKLINYGATLISLTVPDASGTAVELTLGFDTLAEYLAHPFYFGCTVGRVANRIAEGRFQYQNKFYQLACNENKHSHLHGGIRGFDKVIWQGKSFENDMGSGVEFSYLSKAGEENYPGNLDVKTTYFLTHNNELKINYIATTDEPTPVNLTNHTYWNLAGAGNDTILWHELQILADQYLETDKLHLPTGKINPVADTAFDFRESRVIASGNYDHCYVINDPDNLTARVKDPVSGRILEVYTTQSGVQFYAGNYLQEINIAGGKKNTAMGWFLPGNTSVFLMR